MGISLERPKKWAEFSLDLMRASAVSVLMLVGTLCADTEWKALPSVDTLHVIRSAQEVYVFPYTSSEHPTVDRKHLRPLDQNGKDTLKRLLGDSRNWFVGFNDAALPLGVRSVGVLFRTGGDELVLFFDLGAIEGRFRGGSYSGTLEHKRNPKHNPWEELEKWKEQYARPEIEGK
jgi:hypothetical protein